MRDASLYHYRSSLVRYPGLSDCLPVVSLLLNSTSTCTERCDLAAIFYIIVSSLNEAVMSIKSS